ncbi:hypothetical protein Ddc_14891 [Ditylenchus destructor]|nr:hypothetical protein Ddc_14891 [Ditylenchus destructor]
MSIRSASGKMKSRTRYGQKNGPDTGPGMPKNAGYTGPDTGCSPDEHPIYIAGAVCQECSDTSAQLIFSMLFGMSKGQSNPESCLPEKIKMFLSNSTVLNCNRLYISNFAGSAGISISGGESSLSFMSADSGITVKDLIPWLHHKGREELRQLCLFTTRYALDRLFGNIDDMMEEFEKQNSSNKPNYIVELQARNLSEYVSRSFTHRENEKTGEVFISSRWNETEYVHARQCPKELCGTVIDGKSILRCRADFPEFMETACHDHDLKDSNISGLGQNNNIGCLVLSNNHMKSEYIWEENQEENQVKYDKGNLSQ